MRRVLYKSCNTIILKCRNIKPEMPVFCFLKKNPVICISDDGVRSRGWTGKVEKISQAKRVVVVGGEPIRVNRLVRIEYDLLAGNST